MHHPAPVDELELPVVEQPPEQRPAGVGGVAVLTTGEFGRIDSAGNGKAPAWPRNASTLHPATNNGQTQA